MNLKLIETYLPLEALAKAAANERRAGKGTPAALHLWWGNRQVALAKGLVFAQLVDAPEFGDLEKTHEVRAVLTGLLEGDALVEPRARELIRESCGESWPTVHDPFCGVGTIPFAALSLGVPASGGDLNPVAAFVTRLAIGGTRGNIEESEALRAVETVAQKLEEKLAAEYPQIRHKGKTLTVDTWLWARTVPDPSPAAGGCCVPVCTSFVVSSAPGHEAWVEPVLLKTRNDYTFKLHDGAIPEAATRGTRTGKGRFVSIFTGQEIDGDYIRREAQEGRMSARLMAMIVTDEHGEKFAIEAKREETAFTVGAEPAIALPENTRSMGPLHYGAKTCGDIFLPRQQRLLKTLSEIIAGYEGSREAKRLLTLAFSQFVAWHTAYNTYAQESMMARNAFVRQAIPMCWVAAESNPLASSTKRWREVARNAVEKFFALPLVPGGVGIEADAAAWQTKEPVVFNTELPYYDNVAYADLADLFYGWIRPSLQATDPDLAQSIASPRAVELTAFAYRHGNRERADRFYRQGLAAALKNLAGQQRGDYPAVFGFDFRSAFLTAKDMEPLASFVEGVIGAGMVITAVWPLRDSREKAVFGADAGEGYRSLYFVCRASRERRESVSRREFLVQLKTVLPRGLDAYRLLDPALGAADYARAAVGIAFRCFSEYEAVLCADGSAFAARDVVAAVLQLSEKEKEENESMA